MTADTSVAKHAAQLAERAGEVALCLDFEGNLSPIVDDPEAARPLRGIVDLLEPPAHRFAAVALISGRPAAYLAEHAAASGVRHLGLYDLQEIRDGQVLVDRAWRRPAPRSSRPARPCGTARPSATAAPGWRTRKAVKRCPLRPLCPGDSRKQPRLNQITG
jgi:Trehalose-phosphatase